MDANSANPRKPRRGIYLLPNLFTTGALFSGFYAIIAAIHGDFSNAVIAIFIAGVLDGLDGRIARMTNTQSEFGVQYDSLSDMVSFGLAPSLVMYTWSLSTLGKVGWSAAFVYAACAALRLARFNTQVGVADKRYFQGLASPAAAGVTMSFIWAATESGFTGADMKFIAPLLTVAAGLLMVSRFRYYSFKKWPLAETVPFFWILLMVIVFVVLAINPPRVLFAITLLYALSGIVLTLWGLRQSRGRREQRPDDARASGAPVEPPAEE